MQADHSPDPPHWAWRSEIIVPPDILTMVIDLMTSIAVMWETFLLIPKQITDIKKDQRETKTHLVSKKQG